ncbi:MAG: ribbon-helix-helix protein, CopG family [Firmicutes bacterium]|nr:ribbon-helix-helix protein, CopG family [Bacillota bacterium]
MVSVPNKLLLEVDKLVKEENGNRSQFVREAIQHYILERKKRLLRERLKEGYQRMAALNLVLAEEGAGMDPLEEYEKELAEAE